MAASPIEALREVIEWHHRAVGMITTDHRALLAKCDDCAPARAAMEDVAALERAARRARRFIEDGKEEATSLDAALDKFKEVGHSD